MASELDRFSLAGKVALVPGGFRRNWRAHLCGVSPVWGEGGADQPGPRTTVERLAT